MPLELKELTYGIHTTPRVRIIRGEDYGPATKYLAPIAADMAAKRRDADRTALVIIDDDTRYSPGLLCAYVKVRVGWAPDPSAILVSPTTHSQ